MSEFQDDRLKASIEKCTDSTIVCGFGRVGQEIARQLYANKLNFVVIDQDEQHIALAQKRVT